MGSEGGETGIRTAVCCGRARGVGIGEFSGLEIGAEAFAVGWLVDLVIGMLFGKVATEESREGGLAGAKWTAGRRFFCREEWTYVLPVARFLTLASVTGFEDIPLLPAWPLSSFPGSLVHWGSRFGGLESILERK